MSETEESSITVFKKIDYIHTFLLADQMKHYIIEDDEDIESIYDFYKDNYGIDDVEHLSDTFLLFAGYWHQVKNHSSQMLFFYGKLIKNKNNETCFLNLIDYYTKENNFIKVDEYKIILENIHNNKMDEKNAMNTTLDNFVSDGNIEGLITYCVDKQSIIIRVADILEKENKTHEMTYILKMEILKKNVHALIRLTQYYLRIQDYISIESLSEDYIIGISNGYAKEIVKLNDEHLFYTIATYYMRFRYQFKKITRFSLLAIERDYEPAMIEYAKYCLNMKNEELFHKYIMLAINKKNSLAMNELGLFFFEKSKIAITPEQQKTDFLQFYHKKIIEFETGYGYLMMAYTYGYKNALILGDIFRLKNNFQQMEKYYKQAIHEGNKYAIIRMADYYSEIKKDDKSALHYLLMAFENNNINALKKIKEIFTKNDDIGKFIDLIKDKILSDNKSLFRNHYSKFSLFLDSRKKFFEIEVCPICYETSSLLPFDCFCHSYCVPCYERIDKCALCKFDKHPDNKNLLTEARKNRNHIIFT